MKRAYPDRTVGERQVRQKDRDRARDLVIVHLKIPRASREHFMRLAEEARTQFQAKQGAET